MQHVYGVISFPFVSVLVSSNPWEKKKLVGAYRDAKCYHGVCQHKSFFLNCDYFTISFLSLLCFYLFSRGKLRWKKTRGETKEYLWQQSSLDKLPFLCTWCSGCQKTYRQNQCSRDIYFIIFFSVSSHQIPHNTGVHVDAKKSASGNIYLR